jgi:hypothetical protein
MDANDVGSLIEHSEKRGQVILRHPKLSAYRCFLPDLAGFTGFCCTGPSPFVLTNRLSRRDTLSEPNT